MEKTEAIKKAILTACAMSGRNYSEEILDVWKIGLSKYSKEQIDKAIVDFCQLRETSRFPTPYEFMSYSKSEYSYL